ncbi:molybdopterin-binding/glycosyltransferase family 2 protein [uncultured Kiloniella sp.]|uniref:molybdopterin-binding/glycosyltransferase family 2 protein n=1 Tax=uncultured Kiloniella sp. TaxID=1133091 RepID=UPI002621A288|nr:molybdopterin-binding/glycosyltransferase family 2 protein [uncultured Kiloniella sp.]
MIYAEIKTGDAEGTYLAHSINSHKGRLGKGHHLTSSDINDLLMSDIATITTIRLEEHDIHEDLAAAQLGQFVSGRGVKTSLAFTGRCNIYSTEHGVFETTPQDIDKINSVDEAITLATLSPYSVVHPDQLVATAKIIPLAAPSQALEQTKGLAQLTVHPFKRFKTGLILTQLPQTKKSVLAKTQMVVNQRLKSCANELSETTIVDHTPTAIATAINTLRKSNHDLILIFGASAIVDRQDALPKGLELSGGDIEHFGMPVDPGNLLLLGNHSGCKIIGLPGCARSPKLNGFDWILQRILAGLNVNRNTIMQMGCGGLLSEIPTRPQPREQIPSEISHNAPKVTAILLAAGQSRRMGPENKLLQKWHGKPLVKWVADNIGESQVDHTIVVTGHEAKLVQETLSQNDVEYVHNPDFTDGLSTSLIKGLMAVPADSDAVLICLGDMPSINGTQLNQLIKAYDPENGAAVCVPTFEGKRGNPVLWNKSFIPEMLNLKGDSGARHLLGNYPEDLQEVIMDNTSVLSDIDTPEALSNLRETSFTK